MLQGCGCAPAAAKKALGAFLHLPPETRTDPPSRTAPPSALHHHNHTYATQSKSDEQALEILSKAYPGRKVVGVYSRDVLLNAGNVHW